MKINHHDTLGKTCLLDNGIELNVQEFIPKVQILAHTEENDYFGNTWITVSFKFGEHINDKTYLKIQNETLENARQQAIQEASKLYPNLYENFGKDSITGCFFNGSEYAFYYNGFKVSEKELIQHFGGMEEKG